MSDLINGTKLKDEISKRYKVIADGYVDYGETAAFELNWIEEYINKEQANDLKTNTESVGLCDLCGKEPIQAYDVFLKLDICKKCRTKESQT